MEEISSNVAITFGSFVVLGALVFMAMIFAVVMAQLLAGLFED